MISLIGKDGDAQQMMLDVSGLVVGPDLQILFMFHTLQECSFLKLIITFLFAVQHGSHLTNQCMHV